MIRPGSLLIPTADQLAEISGYHYKLGEVFSRFGNEEMEKLHTKLAQKYEAEATAEENRRKK
jgi:hypothetical protein